MEGSGFIDLGSIRVRLLPETFHLFGTSVWGKTLITVLLSRVPQVLQAPQGCPVPQAFLGLQWHLDQMEQ